MGWVVGLTGIDVKQPILVMLGLVGVVLMILALQDTVAGEWTTIAGPVTLCIGAIALIAMIIAVLMGR